MEFQLIKYTRFNDKINIVEPNGKISSGNLKFWDGMNPLHKLFMDCLILISKGSMSKCFNILEHTKYRYVKKIVFYCEDLLKRMRFNHSKYPIIKGTLCCIKKENRKSVVYLLDTSKGFL